MTRSVVISGLGMVTALGDGALATWKAVSEGAVSQGPASTLSGDGFSRAQALSSAAMREALTQAAIDTSSMDIACTVSASKPFVSTGAAGALEAIPPDAINDDLRTRFNLRGEGRNVVAACATGPYSVATAASWIQEGLYDVVLAGSVEPWPHELIQAGFRQLGVVSPEGRTRPFDRDRAGFSFGEGAAVFVLESETHAERRKQAPLARLSGWALGADGHSAVAFNSNGQRIAEVIARACRCASLEPKAIGHVNAHGTATPLNDWIETQALEKAFGSAAEHLMVSATKGSTGHLLGAAGSVELGLTVLALQNQFIPPTATLETPDPKCRLDYTPRKGHPAAFSHALSLSFGFGGPIGVVVVSQ